VKSPQVQTANYITEADKAQYSDLQVIETTIGKKRVFYLGITYDDPEIGRVPGSRDSEYFSTHEEAEQLLRVITKDFISRPDPGQALHDIAIEWFLRLQP
jgi:hypothetical protein